MATLPLASNSQDSAARERLRYAQALMQQGASTAPVQSPLEGLARALTGGVGGYFAGEEDRKEEQKKAGTQETLARALRAGSGQENIFDPATGQWSGPTGKPDTALMAKILGTNENTAPMGLELQLKDLQYQRDRADKTADTKTSQDFQRETLLLQDNLQTKRDDLNRAFQAAQQNNSFENQAKLQAAQQAFTAAQQQAQQAWQLNNAGPIAGAQKAAQLTAENAPVQMPGAPEGTIVPAGAVGDIAKNNAVNKPMTDVQAAAALYADRMAQASKIIDKLESENAQPGESARLVRSIPLIGNSFIGNNMVSENVQKYEQAQRDFVNAVLRKESGAVISDEEFNNARQQYFAQPGDSPAVIEQKRKNRELAKAGIARAAGPSYKPREDQPTPSPSIPAPPPGMIVVQ